MPRTSQPPPPFVSEQNNPFRLILLPVPLADHHPLYSFTKSGRPKAELIDSTKLLCELVKESPLSRKALYRRAEVSGSSAVKYCNLLAKLRMIQVEDVQRNFLTRLHYITLTGKINLLMVTEPKIECFGINRLKLIRDTIAQISTKDDEPRLRFVKKLLSAIFAAGGLELIQVWAKETVRELFWVDPDEERPELQPDSALGYSWFEMISSLTVPQLEIYMRALDTIRPNLDRDEVESSWYYLRRLAYWNPDYFDQFMEKLDLPELAKWISH